jgi:hypothetical protein
MSVVTGCPNRESTGCVVLAKCDSTSKQQQFDFKPASASPGHANHLILRSTGDCLEIDSHDSYEGSPLGTWSCVGAFDQANEWWVYDAVMGHLSSVQAGAAPGPFVASVCTAK